MVTLANKTINQILFKEEVLNFHKEYQGKISINAKVPVKNVKDLSIVYSPGVAEPCVEIFENSDKVYDYTIKGNLVAIVTDGSAVLGLGNIGPEAAIPVMEGKAVLFKTFAGVDAFPICLETNSANEVVETVKRLVPMFAGINLEDIAAPDCFEIEEKLKREINIPVFHDDQHGTAIVTAAGLINALKVINKTIEEIKIVINGAGSAGIAIAKFLLSFGVKDVILCDSKGAIFEGRKVRMNPVKDQLATLTNLKRIDGSLQDVIKGCDVFIGVSAGGVLTKEMVKTMNKDPIIFAMANPDPEIIPDEAKKAGAKVVGTGRSDFPNQVNNVLAFPGIFRGAIDVLASDINEEMKIAAAYAIANLISPSDLSADYVIPSPFDKRVAPAVAAAVAKAAIETGIAKRKIDPIVIQEKTEFLTNKDPIKVKLP